MLPARRRSEMAAFIQQNGGVDTDTLARHFGISLMTARRDLKILEQDNMLKRTWGGAVPPHFIAHEIPYASKAGTMPEAKKAIAAEAVQLVQEESCIILDAGTTTLELAELLRGRTVTVITPDLQIALLLSSSPTVTVFVTGGWLDPVSRSCNDQSAVEFLSPLSVTQAFIGTNVWDAVRGATTSVSSKMRLKRQMMACAEQSVLLADSSKFGTFSPWSIGPLSAFSCIISDSGLSPQAREAIADADGILRLAHAVPGNEKKPCRPRGDVMKIIVVADDLTGANANGALLTGKGFPSATCLNLDSWDPEEFAEYAAVAVTTDSRLLSPADAKETVRRTVALFTGQNPAVVSKRIDSTLRGNVGAEIEGALEALDASAGPDADKAVAVVVPPFPGSGRIASGGYLIVHGIPLECSPIAKDSATPVNFSSTIKVIAEQSDLPCGFICLETVLAGPEAVRAEAVRLWREGCRILVCDGVTDADIASVAQGFRDVPFPILAVDPGPFTAELAAARLSFPDVASRNRVLAVIGSTCELARRQIETLRLAHRTHIVRVDCANLLDTHLRDGEIEHAVERLSDLKNLGDAAVFGVCTAERAEDVFSMEEMSARLGISPSEISLRINTALATIAERLLARPELHIGGLYTSGGEVTVTTIRTLGGTGFSVRDQVIPLAVYGHLLGGRYPGLPMVTKGGFVGDSHGLLQCMEFLFATIGTQTRHV